MTKKDDLTEKLKKAKEEADKRDHAAKANQDEVETLKKDLDEMTELAKRVAADMQNLKRRQEEERKLIISMATIDLVRQILPVLDNLDRAKEHVPDKDGEWFKGIEMSINQLHQIFEGIGLKNLETVGQTFNPDIHEALAQGPGEKNIVIEELEKGYMLGDRVIRHAKIKVGNGSA